MKPAFIIIFLLAAMGGVLFISSHRSKPAPEPQPVSARSGPPSQVLAAKTPLPQEKTPEIARPTIQAAEEEVDVEVDLQNKLAQDNKLSQFVDINSIECADKKCTVDASARGEDVSNFQMTFVNFLQAHPEFGNQFEINALDERNVVFIFKRD